MHTFRSHRHLKAHICKPASLPLLSILVNGTTLDRVPTRGPQESPVTAVSTLFLWPTSHQWTLLNLSYPPLFSSLLLKVFFLVQIPIIACLNSAWACRLVFLPLVSSPLPLKLSSLAPPDSPCDTPVTPEQLVFLSVLSSLHLHVGFFISLVFTSLCPEHSTFFITLLVY